MSIRVGDTDQSSDTEEWVVELEFAKEKPTSWDGDVFLPAKERGEIHIRLTENGWWAGTHSSCTRWERTCFEPHECGRLGKDSPRMIKLARIAKKRRELTTTGPAT